jgi:SAM-dependent methyltransferase
MNNSISNGLMCVYCNAGLPPSQQMDILNCAGCGQEYPIINGIPVIIKETDSIFSFSDFLNHRSLFFDLSKKGKLKALISRYTPSIGGSNLGRRNFDYLEMLLTNQNSSINKPKVLVIGGSIVGEGMDNFVNSEKLEIVEGDVSFGPRTKIIFDGHNIPYQNHVFDAVIVQAVLEHVMNPVRCVHEIHRVLKPNGLVYAETPFMQQVHGGAYDFIRYTRSGHRRLFSWFKEIKSGSTAGSGTALAWSYQYFLLALFGYNNTLRFIVKFIARFTGFWIKYFDFIIRNNHYDEDGASGFYFLGKKSDVTIPDKEIIKYYLSQKG